MPEAHRIPSENFTRRDRVRARGKYRDCARRAGCPDWPTVGLVSGSRPGTPGAATGDGPNSH